MVCTQKKQVYNSRDTVNNLSLLYCFIVELSSIHETFSKIKRQ